MTDRTYAGYTLTARLPAPSAAVERWLAEGPVGPADIYLGPEMLAARARLLPRWGPFPAVLTGARDGRWFVVAPGRLAVDCEGLRDRLTPEAALGVAFHVTAALAELHEQGGAHGAIHPSCVGIDDEGRLSVRPALAAAVMGEPDSDASAQATDCLQLSTVFDALDLEGLEDAAVPLLLAGLRRERARLRMQPGRAVRQALAALLARHPDAESEVVRALGDAWATHMTPRAPLQDVDRARPAPWDTSARGRATASAAPRGQRAVAAGAAVAQTPVAPARVNLGGVVGASPSRPAVAPVREDASAVPTAVPAEIEEDVEDPPTPTAGMSVAFVPAARVAPEDEDDLDSGPSVTATPAPVVEEPPDPAEVEVEVTRTRAPAPVEEAPVRVATVVAPVVEEPDDDAGTSATDIGGVDPVRVSVTAAPAPAPQPAPAPAPQPAPAPAPPRHSPPPPPRRSRPRHPGPRPRRPRPRPTSASARTATAAPPPGGPASRA